MPRTHNLLGPSAYRGQGETADCIQDGRGPLGTFGHRQWAEVEDAISLPDIRLRSPLTEGSGLPHSLLLAQHYSQTLGNSTCRELQNSLVQKRILACPPMRLFPASLGYLFQRKTQRTQGKRLYLNQAEASRSLLGRAPSTMQGCTLYLGLARYKPPTNPPTGSHPPTGLDQCQLCRHWQPQVTATGPSFPHSGPR